MLIQANQLTKVYGNGENALCALDRVTLCVERGAFVSVIGSSGSGKSTLLHLLGGIDRPTKGTVTIDGTNLYSLAPDPLTVFRRRYIGFVFQSYNLIPGLNIWENITLPLGLDKLKADRGEIEHLLGALGIYEKRYSMPSQLSGGQQQRVAIARALATKPHIVLADEPTGGADLVRTRLQKENIHAAIFMNYDFLHEGLPEGSLFLRTESLVHFFPSGGQDGLQVIHIAPGDGSGSSRFLKLRLKRRIFRPVHFLVHQVIHEKVIQLLKLLPDALHFGLRILRSGCCA